MRSIRLPSLLVFGLVLFISVRGASAQANANAADTLNQLDTDGKKQGWWQVEGPLPDRPDYTAGQLFEEGRYTDNRRIGTWRRYWPNGKVMSEITYAMGRPKGEYATYYPDGKPEEKGTWDLDRNIGTFKRWHPNGALAQDFAFDQYGTRDGEQKYYHENGQLEVDVNIKQGREEGTLKRYYPDGELQQLAEYHDGEVASSKDFKPKGKVEEPRPAANAAPAPAKSPDETTNSVDFRANGWNTLYDKEHRLAQQGEYHAGRLWNGKVYRYDHNGILFKVEVYVDGRYAGNAILTEDDKH